MVTKTVPESNVSCRGCGTECTSGLCPACSGLVVGRLIGGRIRLLRLVGQGGMGAVYEGRHETLGRRFAVKLLHPRMLDNPRSLERFRLEALTAAQVESQHIAAALDLGTEEDGTPFIVMEYLEGQDLAALLANEDLPPRRAVEIVLQACVGLSAAHAHRLLHRDLKPANVFICATDRGDDLVKILDFGLAKLLDPSRPQLGSTASGSLLGTPAYMSPEQARGEPDLDARTDVYSMGVILYECLSGRRAFQAENFNALLYKVMTTPPEPLRTICPELPAGLIDVVERAMHKERTQRYPSIDAFADDLAQGAANVAHIPAVEKEVPWVAARVSSRRLRPSVPRPRWARWVLGSILTAATVAAGLAVLTRDGGRKETFPVSAPPVPQSAAPPEAIAPAGAAAVVPSAGAEDSAIRPAVMPSAPPQSVAPPPRKATRRGRPPSRSAPDPAPLGDSSRTPAPPPHPVPTKVRESSPASPRPLPGGVLFDRNNPYDSSR